MQTEGLLDNNHVTLIGKIVSPWRFSHEVYGEGFYIFDVEVNRLSENADILPITVSERLIDKELLIEGKFVHVSGQLRSYNNYTEKKNKLVLTIFAREISIVDLLDEKNPNEIFLNGFICKPPVYRMTPFGREIADILVAVNRAYNKSDYIPCIAWGRNARFAGNLKIGENIRIWGRIQSRKYQKKTEDQITEKVAYEVSISKIEVGSTTRKDSEEQNKTEPEL